MKTKSGCSFTCIVLCLLIPLCWLTPSIHAAQVYSDIEYESPGSNANYLDVYLPDGGVPPGTPTVMFIHGGGWRGGDKAGHQIFHNATADAGYPVVTCNYMLSTPETPSYPQAVHDVKAVVRWIRLPTGGGVRGLVGRRTPLPDGGNHGRGEYLRAPDSTAGWIPGQCLDSLLWPQRFGLATGKLWG
ncbi:MAG: alpha/beta hydrolase fold domain-containing protein [Planctomycetota bacterium]